MIVKIQLAISWLWKEFRLLISDVYIIIPLRNLPYLLILFNQWNLVTQEMSSHHLLENQASAQTAPVRIS